MFFCTDYVMIMERPCGFRHHDESHFHYMKDDDNISKKRAGPLHKLFFDKVCVQLIALQLAAKHQRLLEKLLSPEGVGERESLLKSSKYLQNRLLMYYKLQPLPMLENSLLFSFTSDLQQLCHSSFATVQFAFIFYSNLQCFVVLQLAASCAPLCLYPRKLLKFW